MFLVLKKYKQLLKKKAVLFYSLLKLGTPVVKWIGGLDNSWNLICRLCLGRSKHV